MIRGGCLCGAVKFQITEAVGPFEICHCNRCRKISGSSGVAMIGVLSEHYQLISGTESIASYAAPILYQDPPYTSHFCKTCGSPTPPKSATGFFEIPAGLLDDSPGIKPDKHIYTDFSADWDRISDDLPGYTLKEIYKLRHGKDFPADVTVKSHQGAASE